MLLEGVIGFVTVVERSQSSAVGIGTSAVGCCEFDDDPPVDVL